ncbi:hypothetical protein A9K55_001735 [Cordyceps militaris]|uniref:Uncharacterized protein n=1 Tax=Cordyceps militaris TaxID=73501 RepID=A0A2H4SQP0_CORMI|nr:hypothetical protein A9K55_001735 [Cordyceps militaris]
MESTALPQPDFAGAANSLRHVADNFTLCANLPAIRGSNEILQAIADLSTRMDRKFEAMDRKIETMHKNLNDKIALLADKVALLADKVALLDDKVALLDDKVALLDCKLHASIRNSSALSRNSIVFSTEATLWPLYNLETGQQIANCPPTLAALQALSSKIFLILK